ncbi:unnamed protein product [Echinostoma caproni]|uniref:beta-ketoacyl-[acyl-carrier-protein] synthase I n=1 Tax=Echinostoma caproni TaxID=27848 RepID=A0A183BGU1_9TREM|nr:unnamed protein product [Echinostoma caproni]
MHQLRRVVITGLGVCTPIGLTIEGFWQNLLKGVSGLTAAPDSFHFLPSKVVGVINDQQLECAKVEADRYLSDVGFGSLDFRGVSRASILGVLAAKQALLQAGFQPISRENSIGSRAGKYFIPFNSRRADEVTHLKFSAICISKLK